MIVQIGRREEFDKKLLGEMHKLRAQVFKERKGWDVSESDPRVPSSNSGLEDTYD